MNKVVKKYAVYRSHDFSERIFIGLRGTKKEANKLAKESATAFSMPSYLPPDYEELATHFYYYEVVPVWTKVKNNV